jgi:phospholipase/carboxylesterase
MFLVACAAIFGVTGAMLDTELIPAADKTSRHLLVVLHGLGDSMDGYRWLPDELRLPWLNYLLVNAPDHYYSGYAWFDFTGDHTPGIVRSRDLLFQLLDRQRASGFATDQTMLFGFSQGCLMTMEVGLRYPHRLAGLIGISGWVHEPEAAMKQLSPVAMEQRFLVTHGTYDTLVPFADARERYNLLKAEGLSIDWHEFPKAHTIAGEPELEIIRNFVTARFGK